MTRFFFLISIFFTLQNIHSQCYELPIDTMRMYRDLHYLASDELKGRYPGSSGDITARDFIISEMKNQNLQPYFENDFLQKFRISLPVIISKSSQLVFEKETFKLNSASMYPIYLSGNGKLKGHVVDAGLGIFAPDAQRNDYQNITQVKNPIFLIDITMPDGMHPHHALMPYVALGERVKAAKNQGAKAILLYNSVSEERKPQRYFTQLESVGIPVIYIDNNSLIQSLKSKKNKKMSIQLNVETNTGTTTNIGALLNNKAHKTIIIGAHYDHLGMGGAGSRFVGEAIHYGADDNGSGTIALLELMRHHKELPKDFNYLFLFFGAEEMGLLGSKYFVQSKNFDQANTLAMLNMDMIGRLDSALALSGTGTAAQWDSLLDNITCDGIRLKKSASGVGPSDHASFYTQGIPVLHYFTGLHSDYHKPSDTPNKIYYTGIAHIINHLNSVIVQLSQVKKLDYQETKEEIQISTPRFKVTLGIMPDYTYTGAGLKLDGVSQGKPAEKAGIQAGDIIVKMGDFEIKNIRNYMEFLSVMNKGAKAKIHILRGTEKLELEVEF